MYSMYSKSAGDTLFCPILVKVGGFYLQIVLEGDVIKDCIHDETWLYIVALEMT